MNIPEWINAIKLSKANRPCPSRRKSMGTLRFAHPTGYKLFVPPYAGSRFMELMLRAGV